MIRVAVTTSDYDVRSVRAYLPSNYQAFESRAFPGRILIAGNDRAGWTLDDYVLPRLASGLIAAEELS